MTKIRMSPPLDELLPGQLADFYEVIRDGEPVMVARDELTYDEWTDIADKLRRAGEADIAFGVPTRGAVC